MSNYYLFNSNPVTLAYPGGGVFPYIGSTAPVGYVLCDGASYNRFTYAELFNIIGYTYGGSGDNFNVPDYRDRSLYGGASGSWGTSWNNASSSYNRTITIPTHTHNFSSNQFSFDNNSVTGQASGTYFTHQHLYPWNYDARNTNTNQAKYINSSLITWGRTLTQANSSKTSPLTHYTENSGYDKANDHFNPMFYEWGGNNSNVLDNIHVYKASANADGSTVSAADGGSNSVTQINTAPHETRVNYIMNYGALSNIEDVVHIYSTDNSNYTEYTSGNITYAMFDMNSTDSYFYMEWGSSVSDDYKSYLSGNFGAQILMVAGGGAGGGTSTYLGGGGGAGGLGYSTTFNLPAEKTIYGKIGKGGVDGTSYSETHETTSQTYTGQEGHGSDTILYIDGAMVGYAQGGGSGQDDTSDTSARWGGCAGGYSGTYTAQGSNNLSLSGAESSLATNVLSISNYGIISFQGNTNGAASNGYWSSGSYPSFWWRGGTGGGGADSAGVSHPGPYDSSIRGADGTNGGGAYTWIDGLEYAGGGGGGGNGSGGGGGAGDGGAVASSVASSNALLNSGADGQNATIANRGSGGGGGFTGGSGSDGVVKIAIPKDYILSVTQIPVGSLEIFTTHQVDPGISFGGSYLTSYNGIPYTFFYFTDAQAEPTTGTTGGGQANQNNKFFIGTDPTLTPEQTKAISKIHGVEMLLIGAGGSGGMPGFKSVSEQYGTGSGGGGAGGMGELHNGNLPTNQYIKFLIGQQGDTTGKYSSNPSFVSRGYYFAGGSASERRDTRPRSSIMYVGTTESNVSSVVTSYMGGYGGGTWNNTNSSGGQTGGSTGGSTYNAGAISLSYGGGLDSTSGRYGAWNFYANIGGSGNNLGIAGGGGGAGGAGYGSGDGRGGDGRVWIDGNTYCTGGGGNGGSDFQITQNTDSVTLRGGGSSSIHGNSSANLRWSVYRNNPTMDQSGTAGFGPANSGSGGGGRASYNVVSQTHNNINFGSWDNPGTSGEGGSGLAVIAIPTALIKSIDSYDTYSGTGAFLDIKYTEYDASVTESTTTYNGVGYTIFELTDTTYTQYLSIGFKSGIKALEKYAILAGGFDIPILSVGGGSSGAALSGSTAVGDGGSGGSVVNGNFTWEPTLTTTNTFEFACNIGSGGAASISTRNAGGDTTIDLSGGYGLERYIDASGGEVDGSVGQATIKTLTHYGSGTINTSSSITFNSDYTSGTATGSAVGGAGGAGAGGAGSANSSAVGGNGGTGVAWIIDGANYGPGGGGAGSSGGGSGGNLIGGTGADADASGTTEDGAATSGTANRGSGGGGGVTTGAAGTAGVVKIAIPTAYINSRGLHANTLATSNYLKLQTSGTVTSTTYNGTDYYLLDFQASSNLTTTTHYFKLGFVDSASDATISTYDGTNYTEALTNDDATGALMLCVGGGGSGGYGSGRDSDTITQYPGGTVRSWRIGGGGGAGGYVEGRYCATAINKLYTITVGAGGQGSYLDTNGDVVEEENKGANSKIELEGLSNAIIEANGGGVGCFDTADNMYNSVKYELSQGGSCGGRVTGFYEGSSYWSAYFNSSTMSWQYTGDAFKFFYKISSGPNEAYLASRFWLSNFDPTGQLSGHHESAGSINGSTITSSPAGDGATNTGNGGTYLNITNYGKFDVYGNPGGQTSYMDSTIDGRNNGNPYMSSCGGGGAGGSGWTYWWITDNYKIAYGGRGKSWIDGNWYAAGGGGATMSPESFGNTYHVTTSEDNSIQMYGTGGGSENTSQYPGSTPNNLTTAIIGGSGIRVMNAVTSGTTYDNPYHYMYAGYDSAYHSYQSNISRDGTAGTGSGGGGGFAHTIAEADLLMYEADKTSNSNFSGTMFLSHGGNQTDQYAYEGFNGSGGSGRVKIAIPKQINGVDVIASIETGYTGT